MNLLCGKRNLVKNGNVEEKVDMFLAEPSDELSDGRLTHALADAVLNRNGLV